MYFCPGSGNAGPEHSDGGDEGGERMVMWRSGDKRFSGDRMSKRLHEGSRRAEEAQV